MNSIIRTIVLLALSVSYPFICYSEVYLTSLDFWAHENLENQELRGAPAIQLNTRPLVSTSLLPEHISRKGFILNQAKIQVDYSSNIPFVQNREGNWVSSGQNYQASFEIGYLSEGFTFWLEPLISFHENRDLNSSINTATHPVSNGNITRSPQQNRSYSKSTLQSAYGLVSFSNWYLSIGKDSQQFGSGKHDTLHFSNSHEPFPMIRLGTLSPWETWLGNFSFLTYFGELEKDRYVPQARFSGIRLNWSTSKRIEVGISRSWLAGGKDQNNGFSHVFWDLYSEFFKPTSGIERYDDFRNQQLVFDFRIKIPEIKAVIYGEFGREDHEHDIAGIIDRWYHTQANIIGYKQIDLFVDNLFLILERAETVERYPFPDFIPWFETEGDPQPAPGAWYNHHQYKSGWTYKGIGLGHHLGADSVDEFVAIGWQSENWAFKLSLDREIHGVLTVSPKSREEKLEIGLDGFLMINPDWQINYLFLSQKFENYGQVPGENLRSTVASIGTQVGF